MTDTIFIFLIQLSLILFVGKLLGRLLRHYQLPSVIGEISAGIILGPTILGRVFPSFYNYLFVSDKSAFTMVMALSYLGLFLFILVSGFEIDLSVSWRYKKSSISSGIEGVLFAFLFSFIIGYFLWHNYVSSFEGLLLVSLVLSMPALTVAVRILYDNEIFKTDIGLLIVSSLAVSELLGWIIFSFVEGIGGESINVSRFFLSALFSVILTSFMLTLGIKIVNGFMGYLYKKGELFAGEVLTIIAIGGFLVGALADKMKIHALFGFFLTGIVFGESVYLSERIKRTLEDIVNAIFIPIFFVSIGLRIDFIKYFSLKLIVLVIIAELFVRFLSNFLSSRHIKTGIYDKLIFTFSRMPGGSVEIIIGMIGVESGMITNEMFVAIVLGGIASAIVSSFGVFNLLKRRKEVPVSDYFAKDMIIDDLYSTSHEDAIKEIFDKLENCKYIAGKNKLLCDEVLKREKVMSTYVGSGVAVPHARTSVITRPLFFYARSLKGIDWDAYDGKEVNHIFVILTPENDMDSQLFILSTIGRLFSEKDVGEKLMNIEDKKKIGEIIQEYMRGNVIKRSYKL